METSESLAIEKLYQYYYVLSDAKDDAGKHEEEYQTILDAVKGSTKEKLLAAQFITRMFKHFPQKANESLEALMDLCEDEDARVRKQVIKDMPFICKTNTSYVQKVGDILTQLLQTEDQSELALVNNALTTLIKIDARATLTGVFNQILTAEDTVRERCLKFLVGKIRVSGKEFLTKPAEDFVIIESKKVLQDVTAQEFTLIMELLGLTRLGQSVSGQQQLVDIVSEQVELDQPFSPAAGEEGELLDRLINCIRHALPYFSSQIPSTKFVCYILDEVLPKFDRLVATGTGDSHAAELELLKVFAELTTNCGALQTPINQLKTLFEKLLNYLPLPPPDAVETIEEPRLEFSHVECLIYGFHKLLRQQPDFLSDPELQKDFKLRLHYFACGIQGYIKKLKEALAGKSSEELKSDENKLKVMALTTTNNINVLIKDLFHVPPIFKASVSLSWKTTHSPNAVDLAPKAKKHSKITFEDEKGDRKKPREIYTPPSGKFSTNLHRGGGGGRFRGRNRGKPYSF